MTQLWYATLPHLKMHPHIKFEIPTSNNMRYALDTIILKTRSEVKVKVTLTQKWYVTLRHPKMHSHIKFRIPTSKNIGDMHRTRSGMDGHCDYFKNYVRGHGHSDPKMTCDTPPSQDARTHQIWNSYLKEYRRYAPDTKWDRRTARILYS